MSDDLPPDSFFGTSVGSWRFGPFALSESVYPDHARLRPHTHARAYLGLVVHGGHRETAGAQERTCGPATVVFHPAGERHANQFSPSGGRIFRLEMSEEWLTRLGRDGVRLDRAAESHRGLLSQIASRIFAEFRARDAVSPLAIEGLALEFAAGVVRSGAERTAPPWLATVVDSLHARATEEIEIEELARLAGVHPAHLTRVFRTRHGCSIGEYVRRLRIERAARELAESPRPIAAIAASLGFADQSHFSRVFARVTGLTPGRYRKLHRF
ncbi:MAG TPA: AraC family transcriptional regulator [Thermoanaerobaculia bacterium]|jgi:AraC family transcriptional regulator